MGIDTDSMYASYYTQAAQNAQTTAGTSSLEHSLGSVDKLNDDELMGACKSFESYLVEQVYKGMEKTVMKDDEKENEYLTYFGDTLIKEYARLTTESSSLGLAKQLYDSIKNNQA